MSDSSDTRISAVASDALRLYFEPLSKLWGLVSAERASATSPSDATDLRRGIRRASDRRMYDFAVAFGLVAVVTSLVAATSLVQLRHAEDDVRARAINYVIDVQELTAQDGRPVKIQGDIRRPRSTLASSIPAYEVLRSLRSEKLELVPLVRPNTVDGLWVTQRPVSINKDGRFLGKVEAPDGCGSDCQLVVILVAKGSLKAGETSLVIPEASAASKILNLRR